MNSKLITTIEGAIAEIGDRPSPSGLERNAISALSTGLALLREADAARAPVATAPEKPVAKPVTK